MSFSDFGIVLQIIGFLLLLFIIDRVPTGGGSALIQTGSSTSPHKFHVIKRKIIPDKYITVGLVFGIGFIFCGLIFQLSYFDL